MESTARELAAAYDVNEADDERGGNLVDRDLMMLAGGAQAVAAPAAAVPENGTTVAQGGGNGAEGLDGQGQGLRESDMGQQPSGGKAGGDGLIEAMTALALGPTLTAVEAAAAARAPPDSGPPSPVLERPRQQPPSPLTLQTRTSVTGMGPSGQLSPVSRSLSPRRSPLSRGTGTGPSVGPPASGGGGLYAMGSIPLPLSRFGASASMSNIADSETAAAAVANQELLSGMPSDPESHPARAASGMEEDRVAVLQSLLVIKPGKYICRRGSL